MSIEFLHQGLSEDGKTVKSLQQFKNDYSTKENQLALYNGLVEDGEFDGSFVEFQNKYFPTQAATTTPVSTSTEPYVAPVTKTGEKSEEDLLIEQDAVNKDFWDPEKNLFSKRYGFKREDFSKNKDGKWVHVLDNGEVVLLEDAEKLRMPEYKKVLGELNDEEIRVGQVLLNKKMNVIEDSDDNKVSYDEIDQQESKEILSEYDDVGIGSQGHVFKDYYIGDDGEWYHNIWGLVSEDDEYMDDHQLKDLREYEHLIPHINKVERTQKGKQKKRKKQEKEDRENNLQGKGRISGYEAAALIGENGEEIVKKYGSSRYTEFIDKYGSGTTSRKKWKDTEVIDRRNTTIYYAEDKIGPLTKNTKVWSNKDGHLLDEVTYTNNQTGEELTEEEINEFENSFSYMHEISGKIDEKKGALTEDETLLLYSNPEAFLDGDGDYRGQKLSEEEREKVNRVQTNEEDLKFWEEHEKETGKKKEDYKNVRTYSGLGAFKWVNPDDPNDTQEPIASVLEQFDLERSRMYDLRGTSDKGEEDEIIKEVKEEVTKQVLHVGKYKNWYKTVTKEEVVKTIYRDRASGKRYSIDANTTERVYDEWENGTPKKVIEKWDEYEKKRLAWEKMNPNGTWKVDPDMEAMYKQYHTERNYQTQDAYADFNNISINRDFEKAVLKLDKESQEYFNENALPIIEDIQSEVEVEFRNRFIRNANGELVDRSTNKVISEDKMNELFKTTIQDRIALDPDIINIKRMNQALYSNALDEFQDKWKPTYNLIGRDVLSRYGNQYSSMIKNTSTNAERVGMVNRLWRTMENNLSDKFDVDGTNDQLTKGDYMDQRKHEFYSYFYNEDAFGLKFDASGGLSGYNRESILREIKINQKAIAQKAFESGDLDYKTVEEIEVVLDKVVKIQEQDLLVAEDVDQFHEGFTSLEGSDYIPFISGIVDMMDTAEMYNLAKKAEEAEKGGPPLSAQEKDILMLHQLKGMSDQRIHDISNSWYGAGKLSAEMLPYVVEFIATSGAYSATRVGVQKGIVKLFKKEAIKKVDDLVLKKMLRESGDKITDDIAAYYIKNVGINNASLGASWLIGTVAHTTANPQRYIKETFERMTPEMQIMMSEEGDELITAITGEGEGFAEAFARGFGVTWAEFSTERLGEAVPMFGKFLGKHNPHAKAWLQNTIVAKYMTKFKLSKPQMMKKIQDGMGWNGFIGEMFEEIVNQPLSNLISGNDIFEGMDQRFLEELSISMGATQLAFGGLSYLGGRHKNKFEYSIKEKGVVKTYDREGYLKRLDKLEKDGLLGNPTYEVEADVNNDVETFKTTKALFAKHDNASLSEGLDSKSKEGKRAGNILTEIEEVTTEIENYKGDKRKKPFRDLKSKKEKLSNERKNIFKEKGLVVPEAKANNTTNYFEKSWFGLGLASEVEITEAIASGKYSDLRGPRGQHDYKKLTEIEEAINEKSQERQDILNGDLSGKQLTNALKLNQKELKNLEQSKMTLINPYLKKIQANKRLSAYKKITKTIKDLSKKMGLETEIKEYKTLARTKEAILKDVQRQITELEATDEFQVLTKAQQQTLAELKGDLMEGSELRKELDRNPHGMISKDGKNIFINTSSALAENGGNINVAAHEFLHRALKTMLDDNPQADFALGKALHKYVMAIDPKGYAGDFNRRLQAYQEGSVQVEMDQLEQDYVMLQQMPQTKKNKAELKEIEERYVYLMDNFTANMGEEALTLLSDAMLYGNVNMSNQNLSVIGKIIERLLGAIGLRAVFETGEDVYDFISEFSNSIQKGEVSRKLRKQLSKKAELKGELKEDQIAESKKRKINKTASAQFSKAGNKTVEELSLAANTPEIIAKNEKLEKDILDRYQNLETERDENGKIIVPQDIRDELLSNNLPRVAALSIQAELGAPVALEKGKRKDRTDFFGEYLLKLEEMTGTYNVEKVPFGAYMNTYLPLKYSGILDALKIGEIENAVSEEEAKNIAVENEKIKEERGKLIKLYNRLGEHAKVHALKVKQRIERDAIAKPKLYAEQARIQQELFESKEDKRTKKYKDLEQRLAENQMTIDSLFIPSQQNIKRIGVNTIDASPSSTQLLFGVIPKEGNFTHEDITESQMYVNNNPETIISTLPMYSYVVERINEKTGNPSVIKSIGLPRKILKAFYTKGDKKMEGGFPWTRKENISVGDILKFAGITERGKPNLYKKGTNISQNHHALHDVVGRMMTNQATREYFLDNNMPLHNMGTLQESMGINLFSKRASEASFGNRSILSAALPRIAQHYQDHGRNLEKSFNVILPKWWTKEARGEVIKEIEEHIEAYEKYETGVVLAGGIPVSFQNYIQKATMQLSLEKNITDLFGLEKGLITNREALIKARKDFSKMIQEGNFTWQEVKRNFSFLYSSGTTGGTSLRRDSQVDIAINIIQEEIKRANKEEKVELERELEGLIEIGRDLEYDPEYWIKKINKKQAEIDKATDPKAIKKKYKSINKYKEKHLEGLEPAMRYALYESFDAFEKEVLIGMPGYTPGAKLTGVGKSTQQEVGVSLETKEDVAAQEESSKRNQALLIKIGSDMHRLMNLETGGISKNSVGLFLLSLGNAGMETPLAAAARVAYTTDISGKSISKATHIYEHLIPRKRVTLHFANFVLEGTAESQKELQEVFDDFVVAIIPREQDTIINEHTKDPKTGRGGYKDMMPSFWVPGMDPLVRYFNNRTFGYINLNLIDVKTGEPVTGYEGYQKVHKINGENHKKSVTLNKAKLNGRLNTPARGMSTFDFDETVGVSDNFVIAKREGETQKIPSDQWPFVGAQMIEEGWEMDFTDFNQVTKGRPGPLMQKMKNQIKKYGPENVYILTARASESEQAIHEYLKSEGIEIPLENITGLGNSTGAAKAEWMLEKFAEGYNDMYFVDDALPNVEAVKNVLDQLDVKSNVQIARQNFSKSIKREFSGIMDNATLDMNRVLEQTKGVKAEAVFSAAQAKVRGKKIGKYKIFLPPSAQDFKGLLYHFLAKGRVGEAQMAFFEKVLIKPFARAIAEINAFKQNLNNKYRAALKEFPEVSGMLNEIVYNNFTLEQAIRVYLFNKAGYEIPGLSKRDLKNIIDIVEADAPTVAFAETIGLASEQEAGYLEPSDYWMVENLRSDILKIANERKRSDFLGEWKQNVEIMFSPANLNKIEAIYGSNFREALEDMLHRMEFGTSREAGSSRIVNTFNNWANQSVGAIMFLNMRSALLQTISSINYLNWSDNNPLKAGMALANVPQFIKDFAMIFNSDMLKQRRAGNQRGINEAELAEAVGGSNFSPKAILNWLLTKGFLPTQIADSFAISSGGATFYRNRVNTYLKEGYSQEEAEQMAFQDFQENTEESQQSSRPDMISQQQSSPLGRYILAFKNTPMQYARLIQKSTKDLVAGRGDAKTNMGKIVYYAAVQNLIFSALQTSLGMLIGTDDEEEDINKYERTINSMIDSLLGGLGLGGVAVVTLKNTIQEFLKQEDKDWNADHAYTILRFFGLSPTVGSKGRKLYGAIQEWRFNKDVIKEMDMLDIDNPIYSIIGNIISAITNLPLDRVVKKVDNIDAALTEDLSALQRLALLMGWNTWDLDVDDSDVLAVEEEIKKKKEVEKEKKKKIKKEEKKKEKEAEEKIVEESFIEDQKKEREDGKKDITCVAVSKNGTRCKTKVDGNNTYCTIHESVEQGTKEVQCKKIKSDKKRCKMKTKAKSGYCYYHD